MSFTKIAAAGIGSTETVTLHSLEVLNNATIGGVLTYEDVTNVDSIGIITARAGVLVGSGITLSKDGDGFFTGVVTATSYAGSGANLTGIDTDLVSDTSPQLGGNLDVNTKNIVFGVSSDGSSDDVLIFGASSDLKIYHDGTHSRVVDTGTGNLILQGSIVNFQNVAGTENMIKAVQDGAVELYHNNVKKLETNANGIVVDGGIYPQTDDSTDLGSNAGRWQDVFVSDSIDIIDSGEIRVGSSDDLKIFHDGTDSFIHGTTGTRYLKIRAAETRMVNEANSEIVARFIEDGAVELYHNNIKKFETHDRGTIFTEAGSGVTQGAIKVNTTLDNYGSITVRDKTDVGDAISAFQVENASNGSNETNLLLRSVNLGTTSFAHGIYAAKSHRFGVNSNTTPKVQIDSDGIKFNNDQAADNALYDYEEGIHNPTDASGSSLTFTYPNSGRYTKIGRAVIVSFDITFPTTSSGGLAAVSPPFTGGLNYGAGVCGWTDLGRPVQVHVSTSSVYLMDNNSG